MNLPGSIPLILLHLILLHFGTKEYLPLSLIYRQYITTFVDFQNPHVKHHSQQKNPQQMEF